MPVFRFEQSRRDGVEAGVLNGCVVCGDGAIGEQRVLLAGPPHRIVTSPFVEGF